MVNATHRFKPLKNRPAYKKQTTQGDIAWKLAHAAYSADLVPSEYQLFTSMGHAF